MTVVPESSKPERPADPFKGVHLPSGIHADTLTEIHNALESRPYTCSELSEFTGYAIRMNEYHIAYLIDYGLVEKINETDFYGLKDHKYNIDLSAEAPITSIPEYMFRQIPLIKEWYELNNHIPKHVQHVGDFKNICYGHTVPSFTIHPAKWVHPQTTEMFYRHYKNHTNNPQMPENVIKAIRAFLSVCHRIQLQPKSTEARRCGLVHNALNAGKYRYIKLSSTELQAACDWLESDVCKKLCIDTKIEHDRVLAHFAFALEGFSRPSRVLTIEVDKVEKSRKQDRTWLFWKSLETKQDREYPKMMKDQKFVKWADTWWNKRLQIGYKFMFIDNNKYMPRKYDSKELAPERARYTVIYKEMFKAIGKMKEVDSIYNNDTLYALRHIGVKRWVDRLGFTGVVVIKEMGWEDIDTLLKFYAGMEAIDVHNFILAGNYKGEDFELH